MVIKRQIVLEIARWALVIAVITFAFVEGLRLLLAVGWL